MDEAKLFSRHLLDVKPIPKGTKFGRWTTMEPARSHNAVILCKCTCGGTKRLRARNLIRGKSKSCGCLRRNVNG
jgi:hypothetical protein